MKTLSTDLLESGRHDVLIDHVGSVSAVRWPGAGDKKVDWNN